jgi:mono/diheme cytochrome c family protein
MTRPILLALLALALCLPVVTLAGQDPNRPDTPPARSTMSGVYSAEQAGRGEETYMGVCVSCHPIAVYTGQAFTLVWGGRPLSDLFGVMREKMPKSDPGSLTPEEYAQVVAYLLKKNDVPAGKNELPADADELSKIRIETPSMQGKKAGGQISIF